jgi:hemoglobin-like flavoprotein
LCFIRASGVLAQLLQGYPANRAFAFPEADFWFDTSQTVRRKKMKAEKIALVQQSFAKVAPISETAAELFYNRLFTIAPEVRPMFKGDMKEQGKKLMTVMAVAVKGLSDLPTIVPTVEKLGVKHIDYGVKEQHFPIVAEALLWTLETGLGDDWNDDLKSAWTEAYMLLANTMISAMKKAQLEKDFYSGIRGTVRKWLRIPVPA